MALAVGWLRPRRTASEWPRHIRSFRGERLHRSYLDLRNRRTARFVAGDQLSGRLGYGQHRSDRRRRDCRSAVRPCRSRAAQRPGGHRRRQPHLRPARRRRRALLGLHTTASSATATPQRSATTRRRQRPGPSTSAPAAPRWRSPPGGVHTCAILDNGTVRCWGTAASASSATATPTRSATTRPRLCRPGRPRRRAHRGCDLRRRCTPARSSTTARVRCWGRSRRPARLRQHQQLGDNETAGSVGAGQPRAGHGAFPVSAGGKPHLRPPRQRHRALLGRNGARPARLRQHQQHRRQRDSRLVGPLDLGAGRTAVAITTGRSHTCATARQRHGSLLGSRKQGQLGYGNTAYIGDNETPGSVEAVRHWRRPHSGDDIRRLLPHVRSTRQRLTDLLGLE